MIFVKKAVLDACVIFQYSRISMLGIGAGEAWIKRMKMAKIHVNNK